MEKWVLVSEIQNMTNSLQISPFIFCLISIWYQKVFLNDKVT